MKKDNKKEKSTNEDLKINEENNKSKQIDEISKKNDNKKQQNVKIVKEEISDEKLEKIKNEIKNNKRNIKLSENQKSARRKALANLAIALFMIAYYTLILMGSYKLPQIEYLIDLKTFIIFQVIATIFFFERAFRIESQDLKYAGMEIIINAGMTLVIYNLYALQSSQLNVYISCFIGIITVYYIIKSIIIVKKEK